jgi:hypothetical protein
MLNNKTEVCESSETRGYHDLKISMLLRFISVPANTCVGIGLGYGV